MLRVTLEVPFRCFLRRLVRSKSDEDDLAVLLLQLLKSVLNRALHKILVVEHIGGGFGSFSFPAHQVAFSSSPGVEPFFELLALQNTHVAVEQPTDFGCLARGELAVGNRLQEG